MDLITFAFILNSKKFSKKIIMQKGLLKFIVIIRICAYFMNFWELFMSLVNDMKNLQVMDTKHNYLILLSSVDDIPAIPI